MIKQTALSVALVFLACGVCLAHATLRSSDPAQGAQLARAPQSLRLTFSESAHLARVLLLTGGKEIPIPIDRAAPPAASFDVPLPGLAAGAYTVRWSAIAVGDGHVTRGAFAFTIAPG